MASGGSKRSIGGGAAPKAKAAASDPGTHGVKGLSRGGGGKLNQKIHGRTDHYVYVTRNDLMEIGTFGWLHQSLFGVGMFFFSGAFWLAASILSEQKQFQITPSLTLCAVSMVFGLILAVVGVVIFCVRQRKIKSRLPKAAR